MESKAFKIFVIVCLVIFLGLIVGIIIISLPSKERDSVEVTTQEAINVISSTEATTEEKQESVDTEEKTESKSSAEAGSTTESAEDKTEEAESGAVILSDSNTVQEVIGSPEEETEIEYMKVSFTIPKNWMGTSAPDQNKCYFFYTEHARMMLNRQPLNGANLDSDAGIQGAKQGIEEGGFSNVTEVRTVAIGDRTGHVFTGEAVSGDSKIYGTILYVQIGSDIYTFIMASDEGYDYSEDMEAIISSIKLK